MSGWPTWEDGASVATFFETVLGVLVSPGSRFQGMRRTGGLSGPMLFAVVGGAVAVPAAVAWTAVMMEVVSGSAGLDPSRWVIEGVGGSIAFVLAIWVGSGFRHTMLRMLGAAHHPFEATFRATCYVRGATAWLMLVPVLGLLLVPLVNLLLDVISLRRAQETGRFEALLAAGLPGFVAVFADAAALGMLLPVAGDFL